MPEIKVKINPAFMDHFSQDARYYYDVGGRWSGKTYSILQDNALEQIQKPGLRVVAARKVYSSIKNSLYDDYLMLLRDIGINSSEHYTAIKSPLEIRFKNGSETLFKGADSPEKLKGVSDAHRLILEECNEFTREDFETLDMSIRGKKYQHKTYLAHNPIPIIPGNRFWFQDLFDPGNLEPGVPVLRDIPGLGKASSMKSTYRQNIFCPAKVRERLEGYKLTNPNLYQLWTLGNYAKVEGAIYENWDVVSSVPSGVDLLAYGLDFGFTGDPAALLKVWANSTDIWLEGLLYKRGLYNRDIAAAMQDCGVSEDDTIIADSAEPKSIDELYTSGFAGIEGVRKRANYKKDIISVLQGYRLHVVEGDTDLQREISTYSWARDKDGHQLPKPQDGDDHYMDCLSMVAYAKIGCNNGIAIGVA